MIKTELKFEKRSRLVCKVGYVRIANEYHKRSVDAPLLDGETTCPGGLAVTVCKSNRLNSVVFLGKAYVQKWTATG